MSNFEKSSVKILPIIENTNNRVTFYTEFDGAFEVGDNLYIAVNDTGTTEYTRLDSAANTGFTNSTIGYELLEKTGNRLVLDIKYDTFGLNSISEDTCFIGRIYIKNSTINRGTINGCLIKDTSTQPLSKSNITWKQGILFDTLGTISNIDFNSKSDDSKLVLKTIINDKLEVESFYTKNNYGIGLSIINLSDNRFSLESCDISAGVFNNCDITGINNEINGGEFNDCLLGTTYIINDGTFNNCEFESNVSDWNNGTWNNDYSGTTANNPFKPLTWTNGVWVDGIFPNSSTWSDGRFKDGTFNGLSWNDGTFNGGEFSGSTWNSGTFNDGTMTNSTWNDGTFNSGVMIDTTWHNGTFNDGSIYSTGSKMNWTTGTFNSGIMYNMAWNDGTFNDGTMSGCTWVDGIFNDGRFVSGSEWSNGTWYGGEFEDSTWYNGIFHNGIMKNSLWYDGSVYYGVFVDMNEFPSKAWYGGIWYNGTMNNVSVTNIKWYNGIVNDCSLGTVLTDSIGGASGGGIEWFNGSFNSGVFANGNGEAYWYDGKFYYGTFSGSHWFNGTFYTGDITSYIDPKYKINKPFKPYNDFGTYRRSNTIPRFPAKKRF